MHYFKRILKITGFILLFAALPACSNAPVSNNTLQQANAANTNITLGLAYLKEGRSDLAKAKLLLALQEAPNYSPAYSAFGYFLESTGETKEAENYYLSAIKLADKRNFAAANNNYGTYLYRQNCFPEAIHYFLVAVHDPYYLQVAAAYENAGRAALKMGDKKAANVYFAKSQVAR